MIPLPRLQELVLDGIQQLSFPNEPAALYDPLRYILSLGGKRMRPVLTLIGCDAFGTDEYSLRDRAPGVS